MKKVFLSLMAVAAIALTGCKPEGQEQTPSSNPSIIGTWTCEYEGEYGDIIEGSNMIRETLIIEDGGNLTYGLYAYGEEVSLPMKWFIDGNKFCLICYVGNLMPSDAEPDTTYMDYNLTENVLELNDGEELEVYQRSK